MMQELSTSMNSSLNKCNSHFEGGLAGLIGISLLSFLLTICTFGFAYPWAMCMKIKWRIENTVIEGRRLKFTGTGGELFLQWFKSFLLCIITLGIYSFWLGIALEKWRVERISFE